MFTEEHAEILDEKLKLQMFQRVFDNLTDSYVFIVTSQLTLNFDHRIFKIS